MRLIGTSGHIDHGKSTLVQALTGIHPSHLPEEHAREMTIDLGYAYLEHPDGFKLGVVDVPGHEKLVKNMVAGATGFELALWVVDAREGVMPQSVEHLQILDLLRVRALVPVLTKVDLATPDQIAAARQGAEVLLRRTRVCAHPMHLVDSTSGRGIDELKRAIFALCRDRDDDADEAPPYLPIDRVFSLKGIGTVVTGTLMRGRLAEGDQVELSSRPGAWRIRSLNNHHTRLRAVGAGHRVGINIAGLETEAVQRGDTLIGVGYPFTGRFLNVRLHLVEGESPEWKHGLRMLFHAGAAEMECRVWGLEQDQGAAWAQLELPRETHFFPGQRFILRRTSPLGTVGGGEVLDLAPDRPRRVTPAERRAYTLRGRGEAWLAEYLFDSRKPVLDLATLARRWMVPEKELSRQAEASAELRTSSAVASRELPGSLVWRSEAGTELLQRLAEYVSRQPKSQRLVPVARLGRELDVRSPYLHAWLRCLLAFDHPAAELLREDTRLDGAGLVLYPGKVAFSAEEQRIANRIVGRLKAEGLRPARIRDLRRQHAPDPELVDRVLAKLRAAGRIVLVSPDFALHPNALAELRGAPRRLNLNGIRVADFGAALNLSRKYSVPFLEYLNQQGVLRRDGDLHFLA